MLYNVVFCRHINVSCHAIPYYVLPVPFKETDRRSQQRARPSDDEFNYKKAIPEKKLQEGLQPDFLSPPFKLLNSLQADPHSLAALEGWADMGNGDYGPMDYGMMGDGTWWPPAICGPCGGPDRNNYAKFRCRY